MRDITPTSVEMKHSLGLKAKQNLDKIKDKKQNRKLIFLAPSVLLTTISAWVFLRSQSRGKFRPLLARFGTNIKFESLQTSIFGYHQCKLVSIPTCKLKNKRGPPPAMGPKYNLVPPCILGHFVALQFPRRQYTNSP